MALANYNSRYESEFSTSVFEPIRHAKADLVILAGFLSLLKIPADYKGPRTQRPPRPDPRVLRQGLLWCQESIRPYSTSGVKVSGCTVHFADDTYDTGPIIVQRPVPVLETDTVDTLAAGFSRKSAARSPKPSHCSRKAGSNSMAAASMSRARADSR